MLAGDDRWRMVHGVLECLPAQSLTAVRVGQQRFDLPGTVERIFAREEGERVRHPVIDLPVQGQIGRQHGGAAGQGLHERCRTARGAKRRHDEIGLLVEP